MVTRAGSLVVDLRLNSASFIREMGRSAQAVERNTNRMRRDMNTVATSAQRATAAFNTLRNSMVVFAGLDIARRMIATADAMTQLNSQLRLVTESSSELARVQEQLFNLAQETRTSFESVVQLYTRLAQTTATLAISEEELLTITKAVNQAFIVSGSSSQEASNAIRQFTQALAEGKFRGEEFNSVMSQGIRVQTAFLEELGVTQGELRAMAEAGELTAEVITRVMTGAADEINADFQKMEQTVGQALTQLNNQWGVFVNALNQGTEASQRLVEIINGMTQSLAALTAVLDKVNILWNIFRVVTGGSITNAIELHENIMQLREDMRGLTTDASNLQDLNLLDLGGGDQAPGGGLAGQLKAQQDAVNGWKTTVQAAAQDTETTFGSALNTMTGNLAQASSAFAQADEDFFQQNKAIQMANTVVNTAAAVMKAWSQGGIFAAPIAATIAAIGAAQLAVIASAQPGSTSRGRSGGGGGVSPASTAITPQTGQSANITLIGDTFTQDDIRELFKKLNQGLSDGHRINLVTTQ